MSEMLGIASDNMEKLDSLQQFVPFSRYCLELEKKDFIIKLWRKRRPLHYQPQNVAQWQGLDMFWDASETCGSLLRLECRNLGGMTCLGWSDQWGNI